MVLKMSVTSMSLVLSDIKGASAIDLVDENKNYILTL